MSSAAGDTSKGRPLDGSAFTLRLDAGRRLRLRLASASTGQSSQSLLIELLDQYFAANPAVEAMATAASERTAT